MRPLTRLGLAAALAGASGLAACHDRTVGLDSEQLLEWEDTRVGLGRAADAGDEVNVRYRILLPDGTSIKELDLYEQGNTHRFTIDDGTVIVGVNDSVRGMKPGGTRRVVIPPLLHWGAQGYGGVIPEKTDIIAEIELLAVYE